MNSPETDKPRGVYFATDDHAGLARRAVGGLIDLAALWVTWNLVYAAWYVARTAFDLPAPVGLPVAAFLLLCWAYLAPLKRSRLRTLGYRLTGVRVVDLRGRPPSLLAMTIRYASFSMTQIALVDLLWIPTNPSRQKIGDVVAGTYVVRARAVPAGSGPLVSATSCLLTNCFFHREVRRPAPPDGPRGRTRTRSGSDPRGTPEPR